MAAPRTYEYPVTEYAKAIERLGWNQSEAARILGIDPRTSRRLIAGDLAMPVHLRNLLRILIYLKISKERFAKITEEEIK